MISGFKIYRPSKYIFIFWAFVSSMENTVGHSQIWDVSHHELTTLEPSSFWQPCSPRETDLSSLWNVYKQTQNRASVLNSIKKQREASLPRLALYTSSWRAFLQLSKKPSKYNGNTDRRLTIPALVSTAIIHFIIQIDKLSRGIPALMLLSVFLKSSGSGLWNHNMKLNDSLRNRF